MARTTIHGVESRRLACPDVNVELFRLLQWKRKLGGAVGAGEEAVVAIKEP